MPSEYCLVCEEEIIFEGMDIRVNHLTTKHPELQKLWDAIMHANYPYAGKGAKKNESLIISELCNRMLNDFVDSIWRKKT